ncbi:MAG: hypothetical protein ACD_23C00300G0003 [uncultured bacterium]|nr:MAG: hypothetical protein ACD_23C00300G0003 [uncultured bacterium]
MPLSMGVPVGQVLGDAEVSNTLRWRDGRWETNRGIMDMVKKTLVTSPNILQLSATKTSKTSKTFKFNDLTTGWKLAVGAAIGLLVCTAAIYAVLRLNRPPADAFAVVPDAATLEQEKKAAAVRTVDEPWIRPAPEQPAPVETGTVIPVVPGNLGDPVVEKRDVAPVQAPAKVPEAVQTPQNAPTAKPKPEAKKPEMKPAVILDIDPAAAKAKVKVKEVPGVQINVAKPQTNEVPSVQANVSKPAVKDVPKPATGSGLVAVTPDGKTALFTNTATRLPEKFGVGDKLPSGEVIKSIDANAGIVKTDAKEYRLE